MTLCRDPRRKILERYQRLEKALKKADETIEKQNRIVEKRTKELKRMKSKPEMLSSSDATAEAGGVPSSKVLYRRPRHTKREPGGQTGHGRKRQKTNSAPVLISLDRCTECDSRLDDPSDSLSRTITDISPPKLAV